MPIRPAKAEALMGVGFRARFDKATLYALFEQSKKKWQRVEQMVRSMESGYSGGRTFRVVVARNPDTMETIEAAYGMSENEFANADEERFAHIGEIMAKVLNEHVEQRYMALD